MGIFDWLTGSPDKLKKQTVLSAEQESALHQYLTQGINTSPVYQQGSNFLQQLLSGDPSAFSAFEAPYLQRFNEETIPGIAERFAGMGTGAGASSSSGLYQTLAQAGRSLSTDLAGLRSGLQMQALPQALQYVQQPYANLLQGIQTPAFAYHNRKGQQGLLPAIGQGIGAAGAMAIGGMI